MKRHGKNRTFSVVTRQLMNILDCDKNQISGVICLINASRSLTFLAVVFQRKSLNAVKYTNAFIPAAFFVKGL